MSVLNSFLAKVVTQIVNPLIMLLAAAAFVGVIWGIYLYILHADDPKARSEGQKVIMWGIIGLVIIFGAYGILNLALGTFGLPAVTKITH